MAYWRQLQPSKITIFFSQPGMVALPGGGSRPMTQQELLLQQQGLVALPGGGTRPMTQQV